MQIVFIPTIGGSIGHLVVRDARGADPRRLGRPWRPLVRTLLLCLAIPALVWDRDQRGLHDRIAGTVLIRA